MRWVRDVVVLLVVGLGTGLAAGVSPSTAVGWLPPSVVAEHFAVVSDTVQLAADGQGTMTAAWIAADELGDRRVWTATRPAGLTAFAEPLAVSGPGPFSDLRLAVNPSGAAALVWSDEGTGSGGWFDAATRASATAGFTAPTEISDSAPFLLGADLVVGDSGTVTAAFALADENFAGTLQATTVAAGSSDWASPEPVSVDAGVASEPHLAVDRADRVTAAWQFHLDDGSGDSLVQVSDREAGGSWSAPATLSAADEFTEYPVVAVNDSGRAAVAWATDPTTGGTHLQAAFREPDAPAFGAALDAGPVVGSVLDPDIVVDATGTATVAWADNRDHLWVTTGSHAGGFASQVVDQGPWNSPDFPNVALAPDGAVTVVWPDRRDGEVVVAARRPAGGVFSPARQVTVAGADDGFLDGVSAVAEPSGDVTVAYADHSSSGDVERVRATVLDTTAPTLSGVLVPGAAAAGSAVSMEAAASDRWSGPPTLTWDFGDGSTAAGASASHTYAGAGTFLVRLTATDGADNTTTATRTLTVAAAPALPDTTAPTLTRPRLVPALLPVDKRARLKITSSEAARLVGKVFRRDDGRWRKTDTKRWRVEPGQSTLRFCGQAAQRLLEDGAYKVRLIATDAAGNASKPVTVRFRVDGG